MGHKSFNSVRVPITWVGHLDENNNIDSEWMNRVKEIVDYILEEDLYCIINIHHDGGGAGYIRPAKVLIISSMKELKQFTPRWQKNLQITAKNFYFQE